MAHLYLFLLFLEVSHFQPNLVHDFFELCVRGGVPFLRWLALLQPIQLVRRVVQLQAVRQFPETAVGFPGTLDDNGGPLACLPVPCLILVVMKNNPLVVL